MAKTKAVKAQMAENIEDKMRTAGSVVFINFHGLPVSGATLLRRELKKSNSSYLVVKKTLLKRALDSVKVDGEMPALDGEVAIAFGVDQVAPSQEVAKFGKDHKDNFKILGGILEGRFLDSAQVMSLANIPSREVLYGRLVGSLASPMRNFAGVLAGVPRSFVGVLDAIAKAK